MNASLGGCWAKVQHAEHHFDFLCKEISDFQASNPYRISVKREEKDQSWIFHLWDVKPPDPAWGLILGDLLHDARSALDHLIYQLAILNLGRSLNDNEAGRVQFPVEEDAQKFQRQEARRLKDLRAVDRARLEELQPYNAWDESIWGPHEMPGPPAPIPLYLNELTKLNNIDKHRIINPVWMGAGMGLLPKGAHEIGITGGSTTGEVLTDGCEIGRWHFGGNPPNVPEGFQAGDYFSVQPSLREPFFGTSVKRIAANCLMAVRMTLEMFDPCVLSGQNPAPLKYWDGGPPWL
ncbi:hypothetical protein [Streptomyces sp. NPDC058614]|uniref:hypothetical protein n=1 Tax=Streptomyces sp. NPDC058614 TaxID=3346557 RepID=UPI0036629671